MKVFVFFQRCAFKERKQQLDWDGLEAEIDQSFPHGFITTKLFPASFCELGIERFRAELLALPGSVRDAAGACGGYLTASGALTPRQSAQEAFSALPWHPVV